MVKLKYLFPLQCSCNLYICLVSIPLGFLTRNLVRKYEQELSSLLIEWFTNDYETFMNTIRYLTPKDIDYIVGVGKRYIHENIVQFIISLRDRNMLPAIVFSYNRALVSEMTKLMTDHFMKQRV